MFTAVMSLVLLGVVAISGYVYTRKMDELGLDGSKPPSAPFGTD